MSYAKVLLDLYRLKRHGRMSAGQMKRFQDREFRRMFHFVWEHSGFYRKAFEEAGITEGQLSTLPLSAFPKIDKKILMEHFDGLALFDDMNVVEVEDGAGGRDFLHPLAVEGFCMKGLRDYPFRKIDRAAFEMLAEAPDAGRHEAVRMGVS
ncbi:MAG: hypothetical protein NC389_16625 [Acetatifactor muris]|nr:hypothetical protein [Acetatifactor muris]